MERNLGGKANGNGMDPSGVNKEQLSPSSKAQSAVHIWGEDFDIIILFPLQPTTSMFPPQTFSLLGWFQLQRLKLSCFSSSRCNVFVLIFHRYFPYLHRCKSHFLNLLFTLWLWVSWFLSSLPPSYGSLAFTASYTNICLEGSSLGATLNLQTSICWSPMLKLIISYSSCLLSTFS